MAKREYIEKNRQWLADKAQEAGVKPLPKGIYYKVIASGDKDGRKPSARSVVTAHYTGRTINGRTFDSSRGGVSACSTAQRPNHRLEHRDATDARRRPMGSVYPGGNGLRQTVATRHPRRLHTNLRHGVAQRILTAAVSGKRRQI